MTNSTRTSTRTVPCFRRTGQSRARRSARRLQQQQRPHEPVQPDRSDLGQPARRDRPDLAVRVRARPAESRNLRKSGTIVGGNRVPLSDPTVDAEVIFAARLRATPTTAPGRPSPLFMCRTRSDFADVRDRRRPSLRQLQADGRRLPRGRCGVQPDRRAGLAAPRPDVKPMPNLSLYGSYSRSYLPQSGDQFSGLDLTAKRSSPSGSTIMRSAPSGSRSKGFLRPPQSISSTGPTRARLILPIRNVSC
jgi:hypothetical protein